MAVPLLVAAAAKEVGTKVIVSMAKKKIAEKVYDISASGGDNGILSGFSSEQQGKTATVMAQSPGAAKMLAFKSAEGTPIAKKGFRHFATKGITMVKEHQEKNKEKALEASKDAVNTGLKDLASSLTPGWN